MSQWRYITLDLSLPTPSSLHILIDLKTTEAIIKVARRLEIESLEQQCWKFLMTVLNESLAAVQQQDEYDRDYGGEDAPEEREEDRHGGPRARACAYATKFHTLADKFDCPVATSPLLSSH